MSVGTDIYSVSYQTGKDAIFDDQDFEDYYFIACAGKNHEPVGYPANRPAYNGVVGIMEE